MSPHRIPAGNVRWRGAFTGCVWKMKILIIEDDKTISALLSEELRQWGYQTKEVEDFNLVLETFRKYDPKLVLMDITLPSCNGFYWTQKIRQESNIPIIFISSHSGSVDMVQAMQFGADDYITKPIDIAVTRAKIQAILRRTYDYALDGDRLSYGETTLDLSSAKLEGADFSLELTRTELRSQGQSLQIRPCFSPTNLPAPWIRRLLK